MAIQTANQRQFTAPAAANGAACTPSGVAWTSGAWASVIHPVDADCVLTGVCVSPVVAFFGAWGFEVDIAAGTTGGGGETVIATIKGAYLGSAASHMPSYQQLAIPVDAIPSGSRISARLRSANTDVVPWLVSLTYLKKPISGTLQTSAKAVKVEPSAAACIGLSGSGGAWTNGAYSTIMATTPAAIVITAIVLEPTDSTKTFELDIAEGAAAAEVVKGTIKGRTSSRAGPGWVMLPNPIIIGSAARVAMRVRTSDGAGQRVGFAYQELPL